MLFFNVNEAARETCPTCEIRPRASSKTSGVRPGRRDNADCSADCQLAAAYGYTVEKKEYTREKGDGAAGCPGKNATDGKSRARDKSSPNSFLKTNMRARPAFARATLKSKFVALIKCHSECSH